MTVRRARPVRDPPGIKTLKLTLARVSLCPMECLAPGNFTLSHAKLLGHLQIDMSSGKQFSLQRHHRCPGSLFQAVPLWQKSWLTALFQIRACPAHLVL